MDHVAKDLNQFRAPKVCPKGQRLEPFKYDSTNVGLNLKKDKDGVSLELVCGVITKTYLEMDYCLIIDENGVLDAFVCKEIIEDDEKLK